MVISRVANYALNRYLMSHIQKSQVNTQRYLTQIMTQQRAESLDALGFDVSRVLNMGRDFNFAEHFQQSNTDLKMRYDITESTFDSIQKTLEQFEQILTNLAGHKDTATASEMRQFQTQAFEFYNQIADYLNMKYQGQYLFGGQQTNRPPVIQRYETLADFQAVFDGRTVQFPQTAPAHRSTFHEDGEGRPWMKFTRDDGTGYSVLEDSSYAGRFKGVEEGSVIRVEGTDTNDGYYMVAKATDNRITIRSMVVQDEGPLEDDVHFRIDLGDGSRLEAEGHKVVFDQETGTVRVSDPGLFRGVQAGDTVHISGTVFNDDTFIVDGHTPDGEGLVLRQRFFQDLGGAPRRLLFSARQGDFRLRTENQMSYAQTAQSATDGFLSDPYASPPTALADGTTYGVLTAAGEDFHDRFGNLLPVGSLLRLTDTPNGSNNGLYRVMGIKADGKSVAILPYSATSSATAPLPSSWTSHAFDSAFITSEEPLSNMVVAASGDHVTVPHGALVHEDGSPLVENDEVYLTGSQNGNNGRFRVDRRIENTDGTETLFFKGTPPPSFTPEISNSMAIFLKTGEPYFESNQNVALTHFTDDSVTSATPPAPGPATVVLTSPAANQLHIGGSAAYLFVDSAGNPLLEGSEVTLTEADGSKTVAHIIAVNAAHDTLTLDVNLNGIDLARADVSFRTAPPVIHTPLRGVHFMPSSTVGTPDQLAVDLNGFLRFSDGSKLPQGGFEIMLRDTVSGAVRQLRVKGYEETSGRTVITLDDDQSIAGLSDGSFDISMISEFQAITMSNGNSYLTAPPGTFFANDDTNTPLRPGTIVAYGDYRHADGTNYGADEDVDYNGHTAHEGTFIVDQVNADGSQLLLRSSGAPFPYTAVPSHTIIMTNQGVRGTVSAVGNYYQGDSTAHHFIMDATNEAHLEDNAGESVFEKMFRAFGLVMEGGLKDNKDRLSQSLWLIKSALQNDQPTDDPPFGRETADNMELKVQNLGFDQRRLDIINKRLSERQQYLQLTLSDFLSKDPNEALQQFQGENMAIKASYQAMSRLSNMNLMDYL